MVIDKAIHVGAPPAAVWALLSDIPKLLPHLPGAQALGQTPDGLHAAGLTFHSGPLQGTYALSINVESIDEANRTAVIRITADDVGGRGGLNATVTASVIAEGIGSRITVHADLEQSGAATALEQHFAMPGAPAAANDFVAGIERALQSRTT
ncbi:MAG: SRPBCC family protein [Candidatus Eremiobacteraeota bacterium]|nr:SRPBCC family protein [Candidatus Eremiobacteraeota bacterium]MBV8366826.1 SRPBCC family protein [Candidatus Eremiobacteraeota bacterium]